MRKRLIPTAAVVTAIGLLTWAATAQDSAKPAKTERFAADPVHSSIIFRIKHLDVAYFYGRFNEVKGTFAFSDDPAECALDLTVQVDSVDTANEKRDAHLKAPEYFHVDKHPTIRFVAKRFKPTDDDAYEVAGELTMLGETKPLTVTLTRTGAATDPWGGYRAGFETTFTVKRSAFGMTGGQNSLSDEVKLMISIEGLRQ